MQGQRFDMYLLEAWLPDINGFEMCGRMRKAEPDTPILFFSSAAYAADKVRGLEAGANDYVSNHPKIANVQPDRSDQESREMKRSVKVVKRRQRPSVQLPAKVVGSRNRWSKGIHSWVAEFRQRDQTRSLPPFDSLF